MDEDHASLEDSILSFVEYPFVPYLIISLVHGKTKIPPPLSINQCLKTLQISQQLFKFLNPLILMGNFGSLVAKILLFLLLLLPPQLSWENRTHFQKFVLVCPTQNPNTRTS